MVGLHVLLANLRPTGCTGAIGRRGPTRRIRRRALSRKSSPSLPFAGRREVGTIAEATRSDVAGSRLPATPNARGRKRIYNLPPADTIS